MYTSVTHRIILYFNKVFLLALPLLNEHICSKLQLVIRYSVEKQKTYLGADSVY